MATRMTTLLFGSMRGETDTPPLPMHAPATRAPATRVPAGGDQVALADTELMPSAPMTMHAPETPPASIAPPTPLMKPARPNALPGMTMGLVSTAAVWLGLALFVAAVAYPMSDLARAALSLFATSLLAIVIAFAMSSRPEYA